jgi:hypothetical protein
MSDDRLCLVGGRWYGWQMLPGYTAGYDPYFSPIRVLRAEGLKTGRGIFRLDFWNALYAEGVQEFQVDLNVQTRHAAYLVADLREPGGGVVERSAVISTMSITWLQRFCPLLVHGPPVGTAGDDDAQRYLDGLFPT